MSRRRPAHGQLELVLTDPRDLPGQLMLPMAYPKPSPRAPARAIREGSEVVMTEHEWRPVDGFDGYEGTRDGRCRTWKPSRRYGKTTALPRELAGCMKERRVRCGASVATYTYLTYKLTRADGRECTVTAGAVARLAFGKGAMAS